MRTLSSASIVSLLCAASVWLFVAPQLIRSGVVEPGPFFELMVVLPTPIGLIAAVVGAVAGLVVLVRRRVPLWPGPLLLALGQLVTVGLGIAILVWALAFPTTGWELLVLPAAVMLGQMIVAAGFVAARLRRRRPIAAGA
ncbi:hypothetical protein [Prescottella sp. R16]|uniref:hypothetical protein n=1 Tax=Prescottella sp. R16 TaxID=3064529 RepID=UPI00272E8F3A|nr:hypothetical protein [Prescottella sp. R16]